MVVIVFLCGVALLSGWCTLLATARRRVLHEPRAVRFLPLPRLLPIVGQKRCTKPCVLADGSYCETCGDDRRNVIRLPVAGPGVRQSR